MVQLKEKFFQRETTQVAVDLLSQTLVRVLESGQKLKGMIIETEAYLGTRDPCCHSFGGRKTERTQVMYRAGGCAYVYFTYGMHYCFNIVTAKKNEPEAVLIRALKPLKGIQIMKQNRKNIYHLTDGPARLCQALQITKKLNGANLEGDSIYIEQGNNISNKHIIVSERIGLSSLNPAAYWPLRFILKS